MSGKPNLFHYATTELSQDAFICWLLAWADQDNASYDALLHEAGLLTLNALLQLHGVSPIGDERIVIQRQFKHVDIVVEVGDALVLLIEDKANAEEHGDQLSRYANAICDNYPEKQILPVFFKTGDQSNYNSAIQAGYKLFRRKDFLAVLQVGKKRGVLNAVFLDFLDYLERREQAGEAYAHHGYEAWDHFAWMGFYMRLQELLPELHWGYVPNQSGGFMGAWWYFKEWEGWDVYLQIEQRNLCLKLGVGGQVFDGPYRAEMRDRWLTKLQKAGQGRRLEVRQPDRRGNGSTMTAGLIKGGAWLVAGQNGNIDVEATVSLLHEAQAIIDHAVASSE